MDDGKTAEVTRCCVTEANNANSKLYGAACRACKAMGYESVITYTLKTESGSSLRASGFAYEADVKGDKNGWNRNGRERNMEDVYTLDKIRWRKRL